MRTRRKMQQKFKYRSPSTYFSHYDEPSGLNADIARHDSEIAYIQSMLDNKVADNPRAAAVYRHYLRLCKDSRAKLIELL